MGVCSLNIGLTSMVVAISLMMGCGQNASVRPDLPPSASDLALLKSAALCEPQSEFLKKHPSVHLSSSEWGSGRELMIPGARSASQGNESYFFDENGILVGALFTYPEGLNLDPYPVLRGTLSRLKPALEFYLNVSQLETAANMEASSIFETGDEKSTTQYLVAGSQRHPILLLASFAIDPYVRLFSPYRREFLDRLRVPQAGKLGQNIESQGREDKEAFSSLQQFARGQAAQLAYCGEKNYDIAADAYEKAIASGFTNKVWLAEAHHKLGQSWAAKGQFDKAKAEILQSLAVRPNIPEVLNNLGTVYRDLGEKATALSTFERAVTLRPNYAMARYNLAAILEETNPKRALAEYETFLALVEGIPEEGALAALAEARVKALRR